MAQRMSSDDVKLERGFRLGLCWALVVAVRVSVRFKKTGKLWWCGLEAIVVW